MIYKFWHASTIWLEGEWHLLRKAWPEIYIWLLAGLCLGALTVTIAFSADWIVGSAK